MYKIDPLLAPLTSYPKVTGTNKYQWSLYDAKVDKDN